MWLQAAVCFCEASNWTMLYFVHCSRKIWFIEWKLLEEMCSLNKYILTFEHHYLQKLYLHTVQCYFEVIQWWHLSFKNFFKTSKITLIYNHFAATIMIYEVVYGLWSLRNITMSLQYLQWLLYWKQTKHFWNRFLHKKLTIFCCHFINQ